MYTSLSVVREELLVLRCVKGSSKIEMWVTTNKMDTSASELSWSKSFTMNFGFPVIVYTSLLVDEDKKVVLCDTIVGDHLSGACTIGEEDKYYSEIAFEGITCLFSTLSVDLIDEVVQVKYFHTNNIIGFLQLAERRIESDENLEKALNIMLQHAKNLPEQVKAITCPPPPPPISLNIPVIY
ncbi:hypothetical protein YC2023_059270 [Brassica napus]